VKMTEIEENMKSHFVYIPLTQTVTAKNKKSRTKAKSRNSPNCSIGLCKKSVNRKFKSRN
jgi:hypothetical protein